MVDAALRSHANVSVIPTDLSSYRYFWTEKPELDNLPPDHSSPCLTMIKCGLATFSGVPSLVNFTSTTYFFRGKAGKLPMNLKMYLLSYISAPVDVLDPFNTMCPSS